MSVCEILETTVNGQRRLVRIILQDGKLSVLPERRMKRVAQYILDRPHRQRGSKRKVTAQSDPEKWFRELEAVYLGSRFRARIIKS